MRHHEFHDFDAFAESIRDIDARMVLVNPKRRLWTSSAVKLDGIDVQAGQLGSGNLGLAQLRPDGYFFYLTATNGVEYLANGVSLEPECCAVIQPGKEFCISTTEPHDWNAIFVPTEIMEQHVVDLPAIFANATLCVTRPDRPAANRLRSIIRQVMFAAAECSDFESTAAAKVAATQLLKVAGSVLEQPVANQHSDRGRPRFSRQQIVRTCMEFLEEHPGDPIAVSDLVMAADVSERTLRAAFREYFGMGPNRFLLLRQLQHIHVALGAADPDETTVSRMLANHGVWEFGRFATKYRDQFGELPSETLKKVRTA